MYTFLNSPALGLARSSHETPSRGGASQGLARKRRRADRKRVLYTLRIGAPTLTSPGRVLSATQQADHEKSGLRACARNRLGVEMGGRGACRAARRFTLRNCWSSGVARAELTGCALEFPEHGSAGASPSQLVSFFQREFLYRPGRIDKGR